MLESTLKGYENVLKDLNSELVKIKTHMKKINTDIKNTDITKGIMHKKEMNLAPMEYFILSYLKTNNICSYIDMAYDLHISEKAIGYSVRALEGYNIISKKRLVGKKKTLYEINPVKDWTIHE